MDSQERHELQENDLAEFFSNFGEWWSRHGNTVLIVAMAVVLAVAGWRFFSYRAYHSHENAWADLAFSTSPQAFREVAQAHGDPVVRTMAYLHAGDLLLGQSLTAGQDPVTVDGASDTTGEEASTPAPLTAADANALLTEARSMYEQALTTAPHDVYRLNARLGIAAAAEGLEDWDQARQQYEQAIATAGDRFPTISQQAQVRLDMLADLQAPVTFSQSRAPAEAAQPQTPAAPAETPVPAAPDAAAEPSASESSEAESPVSEAPVSPDAAGSDGQ